MALDIGRRQFVAGLSGTTLAWPFAVRAQQPAMPVVGFINASSADFLSGPCARVPQRSERRRLVEGQNVTVEYEERKLIRGDAEHWDQFAESSCTLAARCRLLLESGCCYYRRLEMSRCGNAVSHRQSRLSHKAGLSADPLPGRAALREQGLQRRDRQEHASEHEFDRCSKLHLENA